MSETIALLSNVEIDAAELADFVLALEGTVEAGRYFKGRISEGERHIWIYFSPEELDDYLEDEDEKADIVVKLGGLPKTHIPVQISRKTGSRKIALNFALEFGKKWPVVVSDLSDKVFSLDELKGMQTADDEIIFR